MFEKLFGEHSFDIHCPSCNEKNKVKLSNEVKCKKCKTSFTGKIFAKIVPHGIFVFWATGALFLTADAYININRASVKTEYKMMKQCIDERKNTSQVRDTCACAVESMSGVIDAQMAKVRGSVWLSEELATRYRNCLN